MSGIQQRIKDLLQQRLVYEEAIDWVNIDELASELVSELKLRELPTSGYLDPLGFLHMGVPDGETAKNYVQYISGWHKA